MRSSKAVAALTSSFVALATFGIAGGCGASEVSCSDECSCQGMPGNQTCIRVCEQSHASQKSDATKAGCAADYTTLSTCLADNSVCDPKKKDLVVPVSACGDQVTKLLDCEFPVMPTGTTDASTSVGASSTGAM